MEKEPLLSYLSPRMKLPPLLLRRLPEDGEISVPMPLTPAEFKDFLIFGHSSPKVSSPSVDALNLSYSSPRGSPSHSVANPFESFTKQTIQGSSSHSQLFEPFTKTRKSNLHRSKTAPAMAVINELPQHPEVKPRFGSRSIVKQAFVLLVLYLSFGVIIYCFNRDDFSATKTHPVVDAFYFCIVTMCTIGYGDITPDSVATKLFSIVFVLVGFGFVDILLSGMVSYALDLQESNLLKTIQGAYDKEAPNSYLVDVKKGRIHIRMKVAMALGVVVVCIGVGAVVMHFVEKLGWLDSFYLSVMSVTTVGYGDKAFQSLAGRVFASTWLLVSTLAVARAFLYLAEARVDKRNRRMTKWVLDHDMTVAEFLAADIDNNGFVSKAEYVIYKLKEMEKITEKDILQVCMTFDRLDTGNCGKITLADLVSSH